MCVFIAQDLQITGHFVRKSKPINWQCAWTAESSRSLIGFTAVFRLWLVQSWRICKHATHGGTQFPTFVLATTFSDNDHSCLNEKTTTSAVLKHLQWTCFELDNNLKNKKLVKLNLVEELLEALVFCNYCQFDGTFICVPLSSLIQKSTAWLLDCHSNLLLVGIYPVAVVLGISNDERLNGTCVSFICLSAEKNGGDCQPKQKVFKHWNWTSQTILLSCAQTEHPKLETNTQGFLVFCAPEFVWAIKIMQNRLNSEKTFQYRDSLCLLVFT